MPFARSSGHRIYWKLEGSAGRPPLVLLNSIGTDMDLWAEALPALRRRFKLLRIDTRGHGASDFSAADYAMPDLAQDVVAAMGAAGIGRAIVAGVSLGGMMAMQLAIDSPDLVAGLALVCTSATMDRDAWTARVNTVRAEGMEEIADLAMSRFLSPGFAVERPEITETVKRGLLGMEAAGYAGCAAAIRDMEIASRLGEISCPTLVMTGDLDTSTPFAGHGEYLVRSIANARHLALPCDHLAPLEKPDELAAALIEFAEDLA